MHLILGWADSEEIARKKRISQLEFNIKLSVVDGMVQRWEEHSGENS